MTVKCICCYCLYVVVYLSNNRRLKLNLNLNFVPKSESPKNCLLSTFGYACMGLDRGVDCNVPDQALAPNGMGGPYFWRVYEGQRQLWR